MSHVMTGCMILSAALFSFTLIDAVNADVVEDTRQFVEHYSTPVDRWTGPTQGPRAAPDKLIVVLASNLKNGGILGTTNGILEAAAQIGWRIRVLDAKGDYSRRTAAVNQALLLKPDGIIINGFDAKEQQPGIRNAIKANIPLVSWHADTRIGPLKNLGIFANVTTDPMLVAEVAAKWAFSDANGKPAFVILTDSNYQIATDKANKMKAVIESLGGTVLDYIDTPIATASQRMPELTTALLQRYGDQWTHTLAINDLYFDFADTSLSIAGLKGDEAPVNIAAGDGSESAYRRIRSKQFQQVTVAEPLNMQGWQLIDEMNRAIAGVPWSGFVSPWRLVTSSNIMFDGGPKNYFDPGNNYREHYLRIWQGD